MSQPPPSASPNPADTPPPPALPTNGQPSPPIVKRPNPLTSKPAIGIGSFVIGIALGASLGGGSGTADVTTQPPTAMASVATPTPSATSALTTPATTTAASPTPAVATAKPNYKTLSSRQFKLMAKDSDAHAGKTYVIYGEITQFDSATGTEAFRADTGPKKLRISYGFVNYPQNSVLTGTETRLKKLVEGDCFRAKVTVVGSYSYDTQIGGNTTVPLFRVDAISVYGSTS